MSSLPVTIEPVVPQAVARAIAELEAAGLKSESSETLAEQLDLLAKVHTRRVRQHYLSLAPVLLVMREQQLYSYIGFSSFAEWLAQPEIEISQSDASVIVKLWQTVLPQIEAAGVSADQFVSDVSLVKARLLIRPFEQGHLSPDDARDLVEMARTMPYRDLRRHVKPSGAHTGPADNDEYERKDDDEEPPYIRFRVTRLAERRYRIQGEFDEEEMVYLDKRLRPVWVSAATGEVLRVKS